MVAEAKEETPEERGKRLMEGMTNEQKMLIGNLLMDIKKLKTTQVEAIDIQEGNVLRIKGPVNYGDFLKVHDALVKCGFKKVAIIAINSEITHEVFDEEHMAKFGWVKA